MIENLDEIREEHVLQTYNAHKLAQLKKLVFLTEETREEIDVMMPFSGQVMGSIPRGKPEDIKAAVVKARGAQPDWEALGFEKRAEIFLRFHDLVLEHQDQILDICQLEAGKARRHALEELLDTAVVSRYYAYNAKKHLKSKRRRGAIPFLTSTYEYHHPVGVVGFVVPWNYPINLSITDAVPALMAGNAVVLKPDHQVSFTALAIVDLLYQAGLPRDVAPLVTGIGPELGPELLDGVDFVMFTGSTRTGKLIAEQAARRLIGCSLELGGKNPMIVLPDADLDDAVEGLVRGAFVGCGQVCVSIERVYIHGSIYERFLEKLVERTRQIKLGSALNYDIDVGSLGSEQQLLAVSKHVEDAREKGAKVLVGGKPRPDVGPFFYEPTVLANVTPGMLPYADETFGPVVSVYSYDSLDEAVKLANATPYGLNASVWSKHHRKALQVATRIRAGTVNINETYAATWGSVDAPVGGMKESGMHRRHGAEGILKYTEAQTVSVQRLMPIAGPSWMGGDLYAKVMTWALRLIKLIPGIR